MRKKRVDLRLWDLREEVNNQLIYGNSKVAPEILGAEIITHLEKELDRPLGHGSGYHHGPLQDTMVEVIEAYYKE